MLQQIAPERLPYEWETQVHARNGWATAFEVPGTDAAVLVSVGVTKDTQASALWVEGLRGTIGRRPKQNAALASALLDELAAMGRGLGCTEMRIEANSRVGWKTALLTKLGFELKHVGDGAVMRKAI